MSDSGRSKQTKIVEPEPDDELTPKPEEDWNRAVRHATIAHEGRPDIIGSVEDPPEDVLERALVSWLWNLERVVEHAYEWGDFSA